MGPQGRRLTKNQLTWKVAYGKVLELLSRMRSGRQGIQRGTTTTFDFGDFDDPDQVLDRVRLPERLERYGFEEGVPDGSPDPLVCWICLGQVVDPHHLCEDCRWDLCPEYEGHDILVAVCRGCGAALDPDPGGAERRARELLQRALSEDRGETGG